MWWYSGSFKAIAEWKEHAMSINGFKVLLGEFPRAFEHVKPLCEKIRCILFPLLKDRALFIGTPSDPPEELYRPIIEAFDSYRRYCRWIWQRLFLALCIN